MTVCDRYQNVTMIAPRCYGNNLKAVRYDIGIMKTDFPQTGWIRLLAIPQERVRNGCRRNSYDFTSLNLWLSNFFDSNRIFLLRKTQPFCLQRKRWWLKPKNCSKIYPGIQWVMNTPDFGALLRLWWKLRAVSSHKLVSPSHKIVHNYFIFKDIICW